MEEDIDNNMKERIDFILENNNEKNLRIGDNAPDFITNTTFGEVKLNDYKGKWLILFSHPR